MASRLVVFSIMLCLLANTPQAQPALVKVDSRQAQGFLLEHMNRCYALFPHHSLDVTTDDVMIAPAGAEKRYWSKAHVVFRRPEPDFALAQVIFGDIDDCGKSWKNIPKDVSSDLVNSRAAYVVRLTRDGSIMNPNARIIATRWSSGCGKITGARRHYSYVCAIITGSKAAVNEIRRGMSGGFVYVGNVPVGMIVSARDERRITALRIEEIIEPLTRWFAQRAFEIAQDTTATTHGPGEVPFEITHWTGEAISAEHMPDQLLSGEGTYRFRLGPKPVEIIAEITSSPLERLGSVSLAGADNLDLATSPRLVRVDIDRSRRPPARWHQIWHGELNADGTHRKIDIDRSARRVRIVITSGWDPSKPIELSAIAFRPVE